MSGFRTLRGRAFIAVGCIAVVFALFALVDLQFACTSDLKGNVPTVITNRVVIPKLMNLPILLQEYFAQVGVRPSPGADMVGVGRVPVQMWPG